MKKFGNVKVSRRRLLGGAAASTAALPVLHGLVPHRGVHEALAADEHHDPAAHRGSGHLGAVGSVDPRSNGFDPSALVRDFDEGVTTRSGGRTVREWELVAEDKEIEVAPGVKFPAWTYNGRVPGPTLRAREGERLSVRFVNGSSHPHTIHFHGIHTAGNDGIPGAGPGNIEPGQSAVYEFDAEPFGLHLYHCHSTPLADHIAKGLYGAFVIDPKAGRPDADELVMVMNGFDTNFDRSNEIYAVNTVAFAYEREPIQVKRGDLVRIAWAEDRIFRESPNVFLCVSSFNTDAQRLYDRLGYETVGVLKQFVVDEHDEWLLRKSQGSWQAFRSGLPARGKMPQ